MKNGDLPAMPIANESGYPSVAHVVLGNNEPQCSGLTKRELFAAMAMQGLCAAHEIDGTWSHNADDVSSEAVKRADALLAALSQ